jgi:acyl carrier protein
MTTTFEGLREILVKDYELDPARLTESTLLTDIELDSLALTEVIFSLEDARRHREDQREARHARRRR